MSHLQLSSQEEERYTREGEEKKKLREFFTSKSRALRNGLFPSFRSVLQHVGVAFSLETILKMGVGIGWLSREELLEEVDIDRKLCKDILKQWGNYTAIGIPAWNGPDIVGVYIISYPVTGYIPIVPGVDGVGFAPLASSTAPVVVMDNVDAALRMNLWAANENHDTAFVVYTGGSGAVEQYAGNRTVFWSVDDSFEWTVRAMKFPSATVLRGKSLGDVDITRNYYTDFSFGHVVTHLTKALTSHQEAAKQLSAFTSGANARAAIDGVGISPKDKAQILSYTLPQDYERVREYLEDGAQSLIVSWNGKEVRETPEGWVAGGKLISSAILRLQEIRVKEGADAEVIGCVVYKGRSYPFKTDLDRLRKSPGEWLARFVISEVGSVPYIEPGWKAKLLELAQQFHEPLPILRANTCGWEKDELKLPFFSVTKHGLEAKHTHGDGPHIPFPAPFSPAEWNAFSSFGFCQLFLGLLVNLLRTREGLPPYRLYLVSESHVLPRVATFLGEKMLTAVTAEDVERTRSAPLPLVIAPTATSAEVLFSCEGNVITSVDQRVGTLLTACPGWVKVRVQQVIEYGALRGIFTVLPELLRLEVKSHNEDDIYRTVGKYVLSIFKNELPAQNKIQAAAFDLDVYSRASAATRSTNVLRLIFAGISAGQIRPDYRLECVRVPIQEFTKYARHPAIRLPDTKAITAGFMESKFLIENADHGYWSFGRNIWDINSSIASVYAG